MTMLIYCRRRKKHIHTVRYLVIYGWPENYIMLTDKQHHLMNSIRVVCEMIHKSGQAPVLVHCLEGDNQTSVFICLCLLYLEFLSDKENYFISVYMNVLGLRFMRKFMVQSFAQYLFIYKFIQNFFK